MEENKEISSVVIEFPDGTTQIAKIVIPTNQVTGLDNNIIWKDFDSAVAATSVEEGE